VTKDGYIAKVLGARSKTILNKRIVQFANCNFKLKFFSMCNLHFSVDAIISIIVQAVMFCVGLIINIKIILVSWKDKETKTWQIQIVYSICVSITLLFYIPFSALSNASVHLADCTGIWFCYVQTFVLLYGLTIAGINSLIAAIMKYVFIVHPYKASHWGHQNIQKIFLGIYLAASFVMALTGIATMEVGNKASKKCFGMSEKTPEFTWQGLFLCNLTELGIDDSYSPTFQGMIQTFCVIRQILAFVGLGNLAESFFYYNILKNMHRYIYIYRKISYDC
jgi:hypothetical protein